MTAFQAGMGDDGWTAARGAGDGLALPGGATPRLLERLRTREGLGPDDVRFAASSETMERRHADAVRELWSCIKPAPGPEPILQEGGIYLGCWLESTGSINAELLSRFLPDVAADTFAGFARHQREDGLFPYKLTRDGAAFAQIQTVTPLARSVWTHYQLNGRDRDFLATMYTAMARNDAWLARWRDTRGTGAVEAFCAYDTGHDLSARFWHVPDSPAGNDPARFDPASPILPFIAPDLTANVACQRRYLAKMAEELGESGAAWRDRAEASERALWAQCFDESDAFFYDRDRNDRLVKVQGDVLLRVLACEIGDDAFFAASLERYLLNTAKFFAKYPLTSLSLDDPRFDHAFDYNSWCGPTNFLTLIRAAHAFEHHGRHTELSWVMQPTLTALFRPEQFPQTLNPFTGSAGFTESYSPSILCLLDFVERLSGIQPRPDGSLWLTGLTPAQIEHRDETHETAYGRTVDGKRLELVNAEGRARAWRDGVMLIDMPQGLRAVTGRDGTVRGLIGMRATPVIGTVRLDGQEIPVTIAANEVWQRQGGEFVRVLSPGLTAPRS